MPTRLMRRIGSPLLTPHHTQRHLELLLRGLVRRSRLLSLLVRASNPNLSNKRPHGTWGHSCGLRSDDTITCWGNNDYGQTDAPTGSSKTVTAGSQHSCGLRSDDTITCWPPLPAGVSWVAAEAETTTPGETASGDCYVGLVVSPGGRCTYVGTAEDFWVDDSGRGHFAFFTAGTGISARNTNINGVLYNFAASKQDDGTWLIEAAG